MSFETTVILCAGPINYTNLPVSTNQSNAMIPVNGKPVIGWIFDDLLAKKISSVTLVLRAADHHLRDFVNRAYAGRLNLTLAPLDMPGTIVHSLQAGLCQAPTLGLVRIVLGDTLIRDSYEGNEDFVYLGRVEDSRRWCLVTVSPEGYVTDYIDKRDGTPASHLALVGYYHLLQGDYLRECTETTLAVGGTELSDVLRRYHATYPLQTREVQEWHDFGHIDKLVEARRRLLQPRYFNSLTINPVLNTITKVSVDDEKLRAELDWYQDIPDELKVLTPRIVNWHKLNGHLHIVQEYYGYPTLAELYVYGDLHPDTWFSILRRILRLHQEFQRFPGELEASLIKKVYWDKTWERLSALCSQTAEWKSLLRHETIIWNDQSLKNIFALKAALRQRISELSHSVHVAIIHGDFCFSNILFDLSNQIVRLVDPRGSFGLKGIYGDPRYDIAKLRHSVSGLYDYILADMFEIREVVGGFQTQIYATDTAKMVGTAFDRLIAEAGYDLDEIRLIEGLLFISMLPLHHDHPARQRMMYLTGLSLLNEVM